MDRTHILKMLSEQKQCVFLPGSLSLLRQKRHKHGCQVCKEGGHGPYWYLTWKEEGKSGALYIPDAFVEQAREAVRNMKLVRQYIRNMSMEHLSRFKKHMEDRRE